MYKMILIFQARIDMFYDFFNFARIEPFYRWVALEPCLLFPAIAAGIALYFEYRFFECCRSVKIFKHLFVPHSVQRVELAFVINTSKPCSIISSTRLFMRS